MLTKRSVVYIIVNKEAGQTPTPPPLIKAMIIKGYCPRKQQAFRVVVSKQLAEKYPQTGHIYFPQYKVGDCYFNASSLLEGEGWISSAPVRYDAGRFAQWEVIPSPKLKK